MSADAASARPDTPPLRVLLVGRGKVAHGIARASRQTRGKLTCRLRSLAALSHRDLTWADVVLLAVPDGAIRGVAVALAPLLPPLLPVLHLSGSRPAQEADACHEHGALHPLASFASTEAPPSLRGVYFALTGTPRARRLGKQVVHALEGRVLQRARKAPAGELQGPAYHAAAALAANGGAALATSAVDILVRLGVADAPARAAIAALLRTVADNVERVGVPRALTGPVARGDAETVSAHRTALAQLGGSGLASYDAIAGSILACAREAGLSPEAAHAVEQAVLASVPRDY